MNTDQGRATTFFEATLPRLLARRAELFDGARGALSIIVEGEGEWTITFGDHRRADAIAPVASLDADCIAVFSSAGFGALLDGELGDTPVVIGETKLISRLGQLLVAPTRGVLGARVAYAAAGAR